MNNSNDLFVEIKQKAPCQYYGKCGGCNLQEVSNHGEYKFFHFKQSVAQLVDNGIIHPLVQIPINSRRRVTFKVNQKKLSFNEFHSNTLIPIANCLLVQDKINDLIKPINALLKHISIRIDSVAITNSDTGLEIIFFSQNSSNLENDLALTEFAQKNNIARIAWQVKNKIPSIIIQLNSVSLKFDNASVELPINSFLQVSKESIQIMNEIILKHLDKAKQILELYSGCGSFTFSLTSKGKVTAIEGSMDAAKALEKAARSYALPIHVINQDLFLTPCFSSFINDYSQVVINPPRNGAAPQIKQISQANLTKKVILVSCSLENFIRDAQILLSHNFILSDIYPIDQFLYSKHLEVIGIFKK